MFLKSTAEDIDKTELVHDSVCQCCKGTGEIVEYEAKCGPNFDIVKTIEIVQMRKDDCKCSNCPAGESGGDGGDGDFSSSSSSSSSGELPTFGEDSSSPFGLSSES